MQIDKVLKTKYGIKDIKFKVCNPPFALQATNIKIDDAGWGCGWSEKINQHFLKYVSRYSAPINYIQLKRKDSTGLARKFPKVNKLEFKFGFE